jgi:hypothetical protein
MADYDSQGLELHHFYRAMAWLGEEVEEKAADVLAPRCVKDIVEEKLFDRSRDLFTELSAVFIALSDQVKRFLAFLSHLSTFRPQLSAGQLPP